nr:DUF4139 domain-containing protein [Candidatus Sigynarchaeota archaeon]
IRPVSIQEPSPYIIRAHKPMPQVRAASTPMAAPSRGMLFKAKKEMFKADEMAGAGDDFAATGEEKEEEAEMPSVEIMDMDTNIATEAEVHEGVGIQVYEIGGKVSVPNGKDSGPFFLKEFKFKSELELYWSSAQGEMVVSRNIVENGGQVLLPGSMRTYIDDEFAGESRLDLVRPFEKFKTGVRESKVIKIKKELVDRGAKKGGAVVKDKIVRHFGYKIKIELLEDIGAKLVAQDAVPISDSTRITVSEVKYSKDPDKNVSGVITWNIDTKGVKKLDITYEFDITYNRGVEITPPLP